MQDPTEKVIAEHAEHSAAPEPKMSIRSYLATRITTLKPRYDKWLFFWCAWLGWAWDAFDFFTVSLTVAPLAKQFHKTNAQITWGITLVLMFRSVGSLIFGLWSDRYGRKWPFIFCNILFIVLELGTGFTSTYSSFLACRALFGVSMGGLYGNAVATALEDCPPETRGILSGIFQVAYSAGYLFATAFARALVNTTSHTWRPLYWFGACPPILIIIFRLCLPETRAHRERLRILESTNNSTATFWVEIRTALKNNWLTVIYMILLMAGFNFMAHGSQDLYPTMLSNQNQFNANQVTVTQVVANLGAISGGIIVGYLSEMFGRRLSIMVACVAGGALLYPYSYVRSTAIMAPAFFVQFFVQGAFGVIPTHLIELSPNAMRSLLVGSAYQLGNLASSASSTIEATIGERYPLPDTKSGTKRYNYGLVIAIFEGCCFVYLFVLVSLGPEKKGRQLDVLHDSNMAAVIHSNPETMEAVVRKEEQV